MKVSAGVLVYRVNESLETEILLGHPGGPYYIGTDLDSWTIPKGQVDGLDLSPVSLEETARREFKEETGFDAPEKLDYFGWFLTRKDKIVHVFVGTGDYDVTQASSNVCTIEHKGKTIEIPEIEKCEWFTLEMALTKINFGQKQIVQEAIETLTWLTET